MAIEIRRGFRHSGAQDQIKTTSRKQVGVMRNFLCFICVAALAGCGGGSSSSQNTVSRTAGTGVLERACNSSDRSAANRTLCNCIQQAADLTLSDADQRLAVTFYRNPNRAQEVRQSNRASDEAFWKRYKNYSEAAQSYCRAVA